MFKITGTKLITGEKIILYIIKNKMFLTKPKEVNETDFEIINLENTFVSYGWIDSHVHCDKENILYTSDIDNIGYKSGVTTVIDAGSVGIDALERMKKIDSDSITNLKIILNISKKGIYKQSELKNLNDININFDYKFNDFIVGYKARMSKSVTLKNGVEPLKIFNRLRKQLNIEKPLMVHIGNEPPLFQNIIENLKKNDIITHIFNYKNHSVFDSNFLETNTLKLAVKKGIKFDVGHGNESFDFECAYNAFKNNFRIDIISTDIYDSNIKNNKVKSLATTMSKFKTIGYSWEEIINKVTLTPAKIFNLKEMGTICDNAIANLTFFKFKKGNFVEIDSSNKSINIEEKIKPIACIVNGKYYEVENEV